MKKYDEILRSVKLNMKENKCTNDTTIHDSLNYIDWMAFFF